IEKYLAEKNLRIPVMVSGTVLANTNERGLANYTPGDERTLSSQNVEAFWISVSHFDMLSVGLNCAVGVDIMRPHIERLSQLTFRYVDCYPNAGLPDGFGGFTDSLEHVVRGVVDMAANGWVNLVGGCCGTTPAHIRAIAQAVRELPPRQRPQVPHWTALSGA